MNNETHYLDSYNLGKLSHVRGRIGWKGLKSHEYTEEGPYLVAGTHIKGDKIQWDECQHINQFRYDESPEIKLNVNDIIISKDGTIGRIALIDSLPGPTTINSTMMLVRLKDQDVLCSEFIFYFLQGEKFKKLVAERVAGSGVPHLFQADMKTLTVLAPSIEKQQKIAKVMNTVDNLIDQTQNLIDKYTAVKQGMMADLFSRGIDLSGTPETNKSYGQLRPSYEEAPELYQETELGWIPKDWEIANLGVVADVIDPQPDHRTPPESENGIPYVGVGDFYWDQRIDRERCRKVIEAAYDKQRGRFQVELRDSIFGKIGTIGQPKQLKETEGFALSANILLIKAKEKNDYVFSFFDSVFFNKQLSNIINTTSQPALGIQTMRDILVVYPKCEKELHSITEKLKAINDSIVAYRKELHKYELIKKGLMQDLLTGKVKV
ncbi:restriction endonuclease subunit S [Pseudoalteromonas tunicata]|uniref:restriction endonuclease subunit S n=1 Tax=Pseudoalteromonas tunicata TaxID=314281 RepID=UPI002740126C|nr:restriction endonuclease subunit S [Pseudoalteromonas tunicata]MDP5212078.1 restriction endonuclease subunit S [Pseudoalteromonas tunicata]